MTIDEALIQLRIGPGINEDVSEEYNEAVDMAIEALKTQPCEDCVSREAVLSIIKSICFSEEYVQFRADYGSNGQRDAAIIYIKALPSVSPQPKTGRWEWVQYESKPNFGNWHCSECRYILCGEIKGNPIRLPKYCPECGAKMQEVQE